MFWTIVKTFIYATVAVAVIAGSAAFGFYMREIYYSNAMAVEGGSSVGGSVEKQAHKAR